MSRFWSDILSNSEGSFAKADARQCNLTKYRIIFSNTNSADSKLGPSINGPITDGNTKLCCRGFILAPFQSTTAKKIDSEHTRYYKRLLSVCEAENLRVTVKRIEVFSSFYVDFRQFSA